MSLTRRTSSRKRKSKEQKFEDTQIVNNDVCEACSLEGDLVCCDGCPKSFHGDCLEPPVSQEDLGEGKWFCNECRAQRGLIEKKANPIQSDCVSPLWEKLRTMNPKEFKISSGMKRNVTMETNKIHEHVKYDVNQIHKNPDTLQSRYLPSSLTAGKKRPRKEIECSVCSNNGDDIVTCRICEKSYHTTCVQPPPSVPQDDWVCSVHSPNEGKNKNNTNSKNTNETVLSSPGRLRPHLPYNSPRNSGGSQSINKIPQEKEFNFQDRFEIEAKTANIIKKKYEELIEVTKSYYEKNFDNPTNLPQSKQENMCNKIASEMENLLNAALDDKERSILANDPSGSVAILIITNLVNNLSQEFTRYLAWQRLINLYVLLKQPNSNHTQTNNITNQTSHSAKNNEKSDSKITRPNKRQRLNSDLNNKIEKKDSESDKETETKGEDSEKSRKRERSDSSKKNIKEAKKRKLSQSQEKSPPPKPQIENLIELTSIKPDFNFGTIFTNQEIPIETLTPIILSDPLNSIPPPLPLIPDNLHFTLSAPEIGEKTYNKPMEEFIIGRKNTEAQLDLSHFVGARTISHKHCYILYCPEKNCFRLHNLGRNGTRVNGLLYKEKVVVDLKSGDSLEMGKVVFSFKTNAGAT